MTSLSNKHREIQMPKQRKMVPMFEVVDQEGELMFQTLSLETAKEMMVEELIAIFGITEKDIKFGAANEDGNIDVASKIDVDEEDFTYAGSILLREIAL